MPPLATTKAFFADFFSKTSLTTRHTASLMRSPTSSDDACWSWSCVRRTTCRDVCTTTTLPSRKPASTASTTRDTSASRVTESLAAHCSAESSTRTTVSPARESSASSWRLVLPTYDPTTTSPCLGASCGGKRSAAVKSGFLRMAQRAATSDAAHRMMMPDTPLLVWSRENSRSSARSRPSARQDASFVSRAFATTTRREEELVAAATSLAATASGPPRRRSAREIVATTEVLPVSSLARTQSLRSECS
mmetsp:Transcript_12608/g.38019  ORF Transcript_12608/g.38019 Transcript_12608/m.38019 type:complete len:249 (+) Transcript_12608:1256-2002(+)